MTVGNSKTEIAFIVGLVAVSAFPLLKIHWNSYSILFLAAVGLNNALSTKLGRRQLVSNWIQNKKPFLISILFFLPLVFSLGYSEDIKSGVKNIQHILPLVVFPLLFFFCLPSLKYKHLKIVLYSFVGACIVHITVLHWHFFDLGLYHSFQGATFYKLPFREAVFNLEYESLHPSYISLWYCFSICIVVKIANNYKLIALKLIGLLIILAFLATIVLLSSRIGFLCLLALAIYGLTLIKNRKIMLVFGVGLLVLLALSITKISFISSRVIDEFEQTEFKPPEGKLHNSVNIRVGIYQCALTIAKSNFWLGVGFGDVQHELDKCYSQFDTDVYKTDNYNTHSYFLHVMLGAGILALGALIYMIIYFLRLAQKHNAYLYICLLIIVVLGMLFENTLSRNHGVLLFAIFNSVFVSYFQINYKNAHSGHSTLS